MSLDGLKLVMVSQHLAIFGGHRNCGCGDIRYLVVEEEDCRSSYFNSLNRVALFKGRFPK